MTMDETDHLRMEVARRFDAYPADDWSPRLLAALIAVFDLEFHGEAAASGPQGGPGGPCLRLVN